MTDPILIIGATSGIGRAALDVALARGHEVRAFARSADDLAGMAGVTPIPGDATKREDVARALDGAGSVISALGIRERLAMLWEKETLFSTSTEILLGEMPKAGVRRLLAVTGFGAGRSRPAMSSLEKLGHGAILGRPYADKTRQEQMIAASELDWTIARPVILTNSKATSAPKVLRDPSEWRNGIVSRQAVAHYLIDAIEQGLDIKGDVVLAR